MKTCPYCAEEIREAAIRCPHCRSDVTRSPRQRDLARAARILLAGAAALAVLATARPALVDALGERTDVVLTADASRCPAAPLGAGPALPPGHPPIGARPSLPPGHPPIGARPSLPLGHPPLVAPRFAQEPGLVNL